MKTSAEQFSIRIFACMLLMLIGFAKSQNLFGPIQAGDTAGFNAALQAGADLNATDEYGQTPLMYAVSVNQPDMVEALIAAGANVNARTLAGWTALHYAARDATDLRILTALLDAGAHRDARTGDHKTPLMLVAEYNQTPQFATHLIQAGAELSRDSPVNADGQTAARVAAASGNRVFLEEVYYLVFSVRTPPDISEAVLAYVNAEPYSCRTAAEVLSEDLSGFEYLHCGLIHNTLTGVNKSRVGAKLAEFGFAINAEWQSYSRGYGRLHGASSESLRWSLVVALGVIDSYGMTIVVMGYNTW